MTGNVVDSIWIGSMPQINFFVTAKYLHSSCLLFVHMQQKMVFNPVNLENKINLLCVNLNILYPIFRFSGLCKSTTNKMYQ